MNKTNNFIPPVMQEASLLPKRSSKLSHATCQENFDQVVSMHSYLTTPNTR